MHILREFAVNRLPRRILHAFFELELILFFLQIRHHSSRIYKERLRDINAKLLRRFMEMTTMAAPNKNINGQMKSKLIERCNAGCKPMLDPNATSLML